MDIIHSQSGVWCQRLRVSGKMMMNKYENDKGGKPKGLRIKKMKNSSHRKCNYNKMGIGN